MGPVWKETDSASILDVIRQAPKMLGSAADRTRSRSPIGAEQEGKLGGAERLYREAIAEDGYGYYGALRSRQPGWCHLAQMFRGIAGECRKASPTA